MKSPEYPAPRLFGQLPGGQQVYEFTLQNRAGMKMTVINYGGIVTRIYYPTKTSPRDVVLGFDSLESYVNHNPYFGALVGRYGNRIADAKFSIDGTEFHLAANNHGNHLHGGMKGFDKVFWEIQPYDDPRGEALALSWSSPEGDEGYPGQLDVKVNYILTEENTWIIEYQAETSAPTHVNLTQHTYFNLSGETNVLDHRLKILADAYLPVDSLLIPLGFRQSVEGTPFDFREAKRIGDRIDAPDEQLTRAIGYDHCWVLNPHRSEEVVAVLAGSNGLQVAVSTSEPGIQFYSGNFLDGTLTGKSGKPYLHRAGVCLETQHFPDSPNRSEFPSTLLRPGEVYRSTTQYHFYED